MRANQTFSLVSLLFNQFLHWAVCNPRGQTSHITGIMNPTATMLWKYLSILFIFIRFMCFVKKILCIRPILWAHGTSMSVAVGSFSLSAVGGCLAQREGGGGGGGGKKSYPVSCQGVQSCFSPCWAPVAVGHSRHFASPHAHFRFSSLKLRG